MRPGRGLKGRASERRTGMTDQSRRWLTRVIVPSAIGGALVIASAGIASATTLVQLSRDPYHNTTSQHRTELEPDTFVAGSTIVSTFQVGRFFSGGASNIGFSTSTDGGATFTAGFLPATTVYASPPGPYPRASDPTVAFDAKHGVWLISYLGVARNGNFATNDVLLSRSTDGLTWGNPVVVNASGHFDDKNWTACDNNAGSPFFGNCYTEFDDNTQGDLILMSTSSDGGLTWSAAEPTNNKDHG